MSGAATRYVRNLEYEEYEKTPNHVRMPTISKEELVRQLPAARTRLPQLLEPTVYASLIDVDRELLAQVSVSMERFFPAQHTLYSPFWRMSNILETFPGMDWVRSGTLIHTAYAVRPPFMSAGQDSNTLVNSFTKKYRFRDVFSWFGSVIATSRQQKQAAVHGFMMPAHTKLTHVRITLARAFERNTTIPPDSTYYLSGYKRQLEIVFLAMGPEALDLLDLHPTHIAFLKEQVRETMNFSGVVQAHLLMPGEYTADFVHQVAERHYPTTFTKTYNPSRISHTILLAMLARFPVALWKHNVVGKYITTSLDEKKDYDYRTEASARRQWVNAISLTDPAKSQSEMIATPITIPSPNITAVFAEIEQQSAFIDDPAQWTTPGVLPKMHVYIRLYRWAMRYLALRASNSAALEKTILTHRSENVILATLSRLDHETLVGYIEASGLGMDLPLTAYQQLRPTMAGAVVPTDPFKRLLWQACILGFERLRLDQCSLLVAIHASLALGNLRVKPSRVNTKIGRFLRILARLRNGQSLEVAQLHTEGVGFHIPKNWKVVAHDLVDELSKSLRGMISHWDAEREDTFSAK